MSLIKKRKKKKRGGACCQFPPPRWKLATCWSRCASLSQQLRPDFLHSSIYLINDQWNQSKAHREMDMMLNQIVQKWHWNSDFMPNWRLEEEAELVGPCMEHCITGVHSSLLFSSPLPLSLLLSAPPPFASGTEDVGAANGGAGGGA